MKKSVLLVPALMLPMFAIPTMAQRSQLPPVVQEWMAEGWQPRFTGMVAEGDSLFNNGSCTRCHGDNGTEGRWAPNLTDDEWVQSDGSLGGIFETIMWGVRRRDFHDPERRFQMNPSGGMEMTWDQRRSLAAYVWSLTNVPRPGR